MLKTFHTVHYKPNDHPETPQSVRCIPILDAEAAQRTADMINQDEPWREAVVKTETVKFEPLPIPTCLKCGTVKTYDLFKGEYCPRCNDWC